MSDNIANPASLGLFGFGMTTMILALHNIGLFGFDSTILSMGIFYGGAAQLIAGALEFKKDNMLGATAFTSYGMFWLLLVAIKTNVLGAGSEPLTMATLFFFWGMLTLVFFICTLKGNTSLKFVFLSLAALFMVLAAANFTGSEIILQAAGVVGLICGASAFYTAAAEIINKQYGKVLPL